MAYRPAGSGPDLVESIYGPITDFFTSIGLGTGQYAPLLRFAFGFGVLGLIVNMWKPGFAFEAGRPRSWALITEASEAPIQPTLMPWWLVAMMGGILTGVFI